MGRNSEPILPYCMSIRPDKSRCGKFSEGLGIVSGTSRAIHQLLQDDATRFAVPQSPRGLLVAQTELDAWPNLTGKSSLRWSN
jgi:hypothetical protein